MMQTTNTQHSAILSCQGELTSFRYGNENIRFRTPAALRRYTAIKEWDHGYLVVLADYGKLGIQEEYIDLLPILRNLYIDADKFVEPIKEVKIE